MTKAKKFKRRVRARMASEGTRYTEARAAEEAEGPGRGIGDAVEQLLMARAHADTFGAMAVLGRFCRERWGTSWGALGSEVLEILWPPTETSEDSQRARLLSLLSTTVHLDGRVPGMRIVESSKEHDQAARAHFKGMSYVGKGKATPPWPREPELVPEDDEFYDPVEKGEDVEPKLRKWGFLSEGEALESLWEVAPDVSEAFGDGTGLVRNRKPSREFVRQVAQEVRRMEVARKERTGREVTEGLGWDLAPADPVAELTAEIRRLRRKLAEHGGDPDEDS